MPRSLRTPSKLSRSNVRDRPTSAEGWIKYYQQPLSHTRYKIHLRVLAHTLHGCAENVSRPSLRALLVAVSMTTEVPEPEGQGREGSLCRVPHGSGPGPQCHLPTRPNPPKADCRYYAPQFMQGHFQFSFCLHMFRRTVQGSALWLTGRLGKQRKMEQIESQREATDESQLDAAWLGFVVVCPV